MQRKRPRRNFNVCEADDIRHSSAASSAVLENPMRLAHECANTLISRRPLQQKRKQQVHSNLQPRKVCCPTVLKEQVQTEFNILHFFARRQCGHCAAVSMIKRTVVVIAHDPAQALHIRLHHLLPQPVLLHPLHPQLCLHQAMSFSRTLASRHRVVYYW